MNHILYQYSVHSETLMNIEMSIIWFLLITIVMHLNDGRAFKKFLFSNFAETRKVIIYIFCCRGKKSKQRLLLYTISLSKELKKTFILL